MGKSRKHIFQKNPFIKDSEVVEIDRWVHVINWAISKIRQYIFYRETGNDDYECYQYGPGEALIVIRFVGSVLAIFLAELLAYIL